MPSLRLRLCSPRVWRTAVRWVFVVRIDRAGSRLRPGQPGNDVKELLIGQPDLLIAKHATSCLHTRSLLTFPTVSCASMDDRLAVRQVVKWE